MAEITSGAKLTEEQKKKVTEWTQTVGRGGAGCCFCGKNAWTLVSEMVSVPVYQGGIPTIGGPVVPAFMLICDTCGHLEMVSAIKAGLMEKPKAIEPPKKEEPSGK